MPLRARLAPFGVAQPQQPGLAGGHSLQQGRAVLGCEFGRRGIVQHPAHRLDAGRTGRLRQAQQAGQPGQAGQCPQGGTQQLPRPPRERRRPCAKPRCPHRHEAQPDPVRPAPERLAAAHCRGGPSRPPSRAPGRLPGTTDAELAARTRRTALSLRRTSNVAGLSDMAGCIVRRSTCGLRTTLTESAPHRSCPGGRHLPGAARA